MSPLWGLAPQLATMIGVELEIALFVLALIWAVGFVSIGRR